MTRSNETCRYEHGSSERLRSEFGHRYPEDGGGRKHLLSQSSGRSVLRLVSRIAKVSTAWSVNETRLYPLTLNYCRVVTPITQFRADLGRI